MYDDIKHCLQWVKFCAFINSLNACEERMQCLAHEYHLICPTVMGQALISTSFDVLHFVFEVLKHCLF